MNAAVVFSKSPYVVSIVDPPNMSISDSLIYMELVSINGK